MFNVDLRDIATQRVVLNESILNRDFLTRLINEENEKLNQDIEVYTFESHNRLISTQNVNKPDEKAEENFLQIKDTLKKQHIIHQKIMSVNNFNYKNADKLRNIIFDNYKEDKKHKRKVTHYYIVEGIMQKTKNGTRHRHYFLTIQNGTKIDVIDSMGDERKDFLETFVKSPKLENTANEELRFTYTQNSVKLQYSSGMCEIYAIKMAFYIARAHIFNSILGRFDIQKSIIMKQRTADEKNPDFFLYPAFQNGLNEVAFGMQTEANFESRLLMIGQQIQKLSQVLYNGKPVGKQKNQKTGEKLLPLYYSIKKEEVITFEEIFIRDLQESEELLVNLYRNFSAIKDDFLKVILQNKDIKELNKNGIIESSIKKIYDKIFDNRKMFITVNSDYETILTEEEQRKLSKENFSKVICIINNILYNRRCDSKDSDNRKRLKQLNENLLELGKMDFLNPYTSIKAGHMYFEALRFQQQLQQQLQQELEQQQQNIAIAVENMFN